MEEGDITVQESYLLEIFDVAKYAVLIEDAKTYRRASQMLAERLFTYVHSLTDIEETKQRGLSFSENYIDLMLQIRSMICKQEDNFFAHDCWLINVWYNPIHFMPLSENTLQFIWKFMLNVIDANKEDWFMSYWTYAEQYYRFCVEANMESRNAPLFQKQSALLKLMHLGFGAYLLFKKKYSLLKKILNFTQTMPASYCLLDNTFSKILEDMGQIYEQLNYPLALTQKYMMSGLMNDVNSDSYVAGKFNAYFALLMVRLTGVDYNVSYCDPLQLPTIALDSDIPTLKKQIMYVDVLQHFLSKDETVQALNTLGYTNPQKSKAMTALNSYREVLVSTINNMEEHPEKDPLKIEYIKDNLIHEIQTQKMYLPIKDDSTLTDDITTDEYYSEQACEVSKEDIAKKMNRLSVNLEEVVISCVLIQERQLYNSFFLMNKPVITYTIRFRDLMQAWRKLGVDDKFVILSMGVYLGTYEDLHGKDELFEYNGREGAFNGAKIISLQSSMLSFVIIPKDSLPYIEYSKIDNDKAKDLKCIDEDSALYSNVESLTPDNNVLVVKRKVGIIHKEKITKYIMLKVEYRNDSLLFDLDKISKIDQFIVTKN